MMWKETKIEWKVFKEKEWERVVEERKGKDKDKDKEKEIEK